MPPNASGRADENNQEGPNGVDKRNHNLWWIHPQGRCFYLFENGGKLAGGRHRINGISKADVDLHANPRLIESCDKPRPNTFILRVFSNDLGLNTVGVEHDSVVSRHSGDLTDLRGDGTRSG